MIPSLSPPLLIALLSGLSAIGLWLLLPRGNARGRRLGALLLAADFGILFVRCAPRVGERLPQFILWTLTALVVASAVATVATRKPVYSAIWFAMMLLATSGLLLLQGAQFLGLATVVVYAGAILVTFLFVLMLASPQGTDVYDRLSWESFPAALAGASLIGLVTYLSAGALPKEEVQAQIQPQVLADTHMAALGGELFSRHLLAVEVAGTLLLVGLVGAVAIAAHDHAGPSTLGIAAVEQNGRAPGAAR